MIKADNLTKNYGDFTLNITMNIPEGRVSGLVGRNGSGKSTTIKAILGLIRPDGGTVTVMGKDAGTFGPEEKKKTGAAFSDSGFSTYLCINDIIRILRGMYSDFDEEWFRTKCSEYALPLDKRLKDFSTGMNAGLRVITACSHKAKLLILDEPTAGLDVIARNEVLDMLRDYLSEDEERTMLISSHISADLEGLCDDIYMIHDGKIILHEDTDVILSDYALMKVTGERYESLDKQYILKSRKESYGYSCLTNQRQFYAENYPDIVMEKGGIDELIIMMSQ